MPPQAQPAPTSPPKLHGRHKHQPSNPDDMNKCLQPNNSDPESNDGEHTGRSTTAWKRLTIAGKKAQKRGKKTQCVACLFFFFFIDFYSIYRKMAAQRAAEDAQLTPYFLFFIYLLLFILQIRTTFGGQPPHCGPSAMLPNLTSPKPW